MISLVQLNSILSLTRLSEECDLYVPLFTPDPLVSAPYVEKSRRLSLLWHHLSLPYCRNGPATDMRRMCNCQRPQHSPALVKPSEALSLTLCIAMCTCVRVVLVPYNGANVLGCSMAMQPSLIQFSQFTHSASAPSQQHRQQQQHLSARAQQEDRPNTWRIHSLPIMQQFQPIHDTPPAASPADSFLASRTVGTGSSAGRQLSARHSRRKGARVRDEDGEADDNDEDDDSERTSSSASPHFVLAEFLIARGVPAASVSSFVADVDSVDPLDSRQLCLTEQCVRLAEREEKKDSRDANATPQLMSVCSVYSCDAIGGWLRGLSALAADVRRDAAKGLVKMGREDSNMSADDWNDCVSALRDKAEAYYVDSRRL